MDKPSITDQTGIGKTAESVATVTEEFRLLLYEFLSPAAKEAGSALASYCRLFRAENAAKVLRKAIEIRRKRKLSNQSTHPKILSQIVEKSSLEDDEYLQDFWASLLAESGSSKFKQYYVSIASELSQLEARILSHIYVQGALRPAMTTDFGANEEFAELRPSEPLEDGGVGMIGGETPYIFCGKSLAIEELYSIFESNMDIPEFDAKTLIHEALQNLERLNVVTTVSIRKRSQVYREARIALTILGSRLLKIVSPSDGTEPDAQQDGGHNG